MTLNAIKFDLYELIENKNIKMDYVSEIVDALSDMMYVEGKIADILIVNGKKRSKKSKEIVECRSFRKQRK